MKLYYTLWRPFSAVILLLCCIVSSPLQAQPVEFRGGGFLSDFSEGCAPFFVPDNRVYINVRYRPAGLGSNDANSLLAFSNEFFWQHTFTLEDAEFNEDWQRTVGFFGGILTERARPAPVLRFRNQQPEMLTEDSQDVYIFGQVRHMFQRGCRANYRIALIRRP